MALRFEELLSPLPKGGLEGEIKVGIRIQVHEDPDDGGYYAVTPDVPGCASRGTTMEEAVENFKEAIRFFLIENAH
ncbi:type II toxin-antitoxin system HicB family antitoxin [Desulfotomaculum sp. 1211_IL3151]|uniref:type II toxin-antitoxin system HicB family antitoxin n=1 Tax=Desulfotomaculum sp. 1211_IL3151 TaxID=3084055 RepID=UPI002FDB3FE4